MNLCYRVLSTDLVDLPALYSSIPDVINLQKISQAFSSFSKTIESNLSYSLAYSRLLTSKYNCLAEKYKEVYLNYINKTSLYFSSFVQEPSYRKNETDFSNFSDSSGVCNTDIDLETTMLKDNLLRIVVICLVSGLNGKSFRELHLVLVSHINTPLEAFWTDIASEYSCRPIWLLKAIFSMVFPALDWILKVFLSNLIINLQNCCDNELFIYSLVDYLYRETYDYINISYDDTCNRRDSDQEMSWLTTRYMLEKQRRSDFKEKVVNYLADICAPRVSWSKFLQTHSPSFTQRCIAMVFSLFLSFPEKVVNLFIKRIFSYLLNKIDFTGALCSVITSQRVSHLCAKELYKAWLNLQDEPLSLEMPKRTTSHTNQCSDLVNLFFRLAKKKAETSASTNSSFLGELVLANIKSEVDSLTRNACQLAISSRYQSLLNLLTSINLCFSSDVSLSLYSWNEVKSLAKRIAYHQIDQKVNSTVLPLMSELCIPQFITRVVFSEMDKIIDQVVDLVSTPALQQGFISHIVKC